MSNRNSRALSPSDRPAVRICWLPFDDTELAGLLTDGWREVHREIFGSKIRVEVSNAPLPPAPEPPPPQEGGRKTRNLRHAGPVGAFVRGHKARAWTR